MSLSERFRSRALNRLQTLYGNDANACLHRIEELASKYDRLPQRSADRLWSEKNVVLITYGDQIRSPGCSPLAALKGFLLNHQLHRCINSVHLLPFFPYSSDDGFSVIDYKRVNPECGDWSDVGTLGESFDLTFDLVLNHCSKEHRWFHGFLKGKEPYDRYFLEIDPSLDLSGVTRPRSLPLLTPFETSRGTRRVWTTFSDDQVDLNFANPQVLCEMIDVLLFYVERGARIIRLDAIAYLWKKLGTSCIHLPETHCVVKLLRDVLEEVAPGTILLTETNVPHAENVSYFGNGDEAQMVYQFSLAPLLLDAFLSNDAGPLNSWLAGLEPAGEGTTFFNFTASHDGIGVRPLEGLVSPERFERLVESVQSRGGLVSTKRNPDGTDSPYELNVTYFSALGDPREKDSEIHVRRFLCSQAVMLALRGIPGIYFHSLVGTENDLQGVESTGRARSINRRKYQRQELENMLADDRSAQQKVFRGYRKMIETRIRQPAFHPDALQRVVDIQHPSLISFLRCSLDGQQNILVLANVSDEPVSVDLPRIVIPELTHDLLSGAKLTGRTITLEACGGVWLASG